MYDDITSLCKKDEFINKQNLNKLSVQIDIIKELQDFKNNFKKYNKYLDTLNNYKNKTYNFYDVTVLIKKYQIKNMLVMKILLILIQSIIILRL